MGRKDIGKRETKKPKKGGTKVTSPSILFAPPVQVEVIKKGKKAPPEEEQ